MKASVSSISERLLSSAQVIGYGSVAAGGQKNLNDRFNGIWRSASAVAVLTGCSKPKAVTEFSLSADGNRPKAEVARLKSGRSTFEFTGAARLYRAASLGAQS